MFFMGSFRDIRTGADVVVVLISVMSFSIVAPPVESRDSLYTAVGGCVEDP